MLKNKKMLCFIKLDEQKLIHKYIKILVDITVDSSGLFTVSSRLTMMLNQRGIYELEGLTSFITKHFERFKKLINLSSDFTFKIPILIIFPKRKFNTIVYVFNPFINSFLMDIIYLNILDNYLFLRNKFLLYVFMKRTSYKFIKSYYDKLLRLRSKIRLRKNPCLSNNRLIYYFFKKQKKF